jgi:DNA-binding IclR family transcriptional regulator
MAGDVGDGASGVLPRAHVILKAVASAGYHGVRLKDLADRTAISRPTVHRMLHDLGSIGFVAQLSNRRYVLGRELYWLGLAVPFAMPELPEIRAVADELARRTGDTVYVAAREAGGARYLLRAEGDYPLQSRTVSPGEVKPFTASYSGLALLAGLPPEVQEDAFARAGADSAQHPSDSILVDAQLRTAIAHVGEAGWCTGSDLMMPGLSGMAAPVPTGSDASPVLAVSISAADARLTPDRTLELAPLLLGATERIRAIFSR